MEYLGRLVNFKKNVKDFLKNLDILMMKRFIKTLQSVKWNHFTSSETFIYLFLSIGEFFKKMPLILEVTELPILHIVILPLTHNIYTMEGKKHENQL